LKLSILQNLLGTQRQPEAEVKCLCDAVECVHSYPPADTLFGSWPLLQFADVAIRATGWYNTCVAFSGDSIRQPAGLPASAKCGSCSCSAYKDALVLHPDFYIVCCCTVVPRHLIPCLVKLRGVPSGKRERGKTKF